MAIALLGGCAGPSPLPPGAGELVGYFAAVSRMAAAGQKKELAQAAEAWGREPTPYARVKLGGLYAQPAPALRDDARALSLLEPAPAEAGLADLAALLHAQVAERQRLARDEAKKLEAMRASNESMKERLEAMKAIERSIQQREERQRTR